MKRILNISVVLLTCITVLCCNILTPIVASAADYEDEYLSCVDTVTVCSDTLSNSGVVLANADGGLLYSFGPEFTAIGATLAEIAPWAAGILIIGGGISIGGKVCYESSKELIEKSPQLFIDVLTLIVQELNPEYIAELEAIGEHMVEGTFFEVSATLLQGIADAWNKVNNVDTSIGYDFSLSFPSSYIVNITKSTDYLDGDISLSYPSYEWLSLSYNYKQWGTTVTGSNSYFTRTVSLPADKTAVDEAWQSISNKTTGSTLTTNLRFDVGVGDNWPYLLSRFMKVNDPDLGTFYQFATCQGAARPQALYSVVSGMEWFSINNTGTILDGKTFISAVWDATAGNWIYTDNTGKTVTFPVDPIALLVSNTGILTTGDLTVPEDDDDIAVINPGFPTDTEVITPPIVIPQGDTIPIVTPMVDIPNITITKTDDNKIYPEPPIIVLDDPNALKDFIENFWEQIRGIFDWLPPDVTERLNGIFGTLVAMLVVFVVIKIIDIVWP